MTVDQLDFFPSEYLASKIMYVGKAATPYENIGLGLFKDSSLMGVFQLTPLKFTSVNMILSSHDPWIIPNLDQI